MFCDLSGLTQLGPAAWGPTYHCPSSLCFIPKPERIFFAPLDGFEPQRNRVVIP